VSLHRLRQAPQFCMHSVPEDAHCIHTKAAVNLHSCASGCRTRAATAGAKVARIERPLSLTSNSGTEPVQTAALNHAALTSAVPACATIGPGLNGQAFRLHLLSVDLSLPIIPPNSAGGQHLASHVFIAHCCAACLLVQRACWCPARRRPGLAEHAASALYSLEQPDHSDTCWAAAGWSARLLVAAFPVGLLAAARTVLNSSTLGTLVELGPALHLVTCRVAATHAP
jgi:hypothetical protein